MKKNLILILIILFSLSCDKIGTSSNNLTISVIDNSNQPISNIKVTLFANDNSQKVGYTDANGEVGFDIKTQMDDVNSIYFEKALISDTDKEENGGFFSSQEIKIDYKQDLYVVTLEKMVTP